MSEPAESQRPPGSPEARLMSDWVEAERNAADWTRYLGYSDARVTPPGPDGGIDIIGKGAVGQVKAYNKGAIPTGMLQQLYGAAAKHQGRQLLFFTTAASFASPAVAYANDVGMALYTMRLDGLIAPVGRRATELLRSAVSAHSTRPAGPASPSATPRTATTPIARAAGRSGRLGRDRTPRLFSSNSPDPRLGAVLSEAQRRAAERRGLNPTTRQVSEAGLGPQTHRDEYLAAKEAVKQKRDTTAPASAPVSVRAAYRAEMAKRENGARLPPARASRTAVPSLIGGLSSAIALSAAAAVAWLFAAAAITSLASGDHVLGFVFSCLLVPSAIFITVRLFESIGRLRNRNRNPDGSRSMGG